MTGRSVELLNKPADSRPPNASLAFNPHADSPSIRRTQGVNPGKSAPVSRAVLNGGTANGPTPNAVPPSGPGNAVNSATTPVRTNFVNPAADMNRRIGAPQGLSAGGPNRGAYRPPMMNGAKRPALTDVSNLQQLDGPNDAKKPKVEPTAPAVQGEPQKAANAPAAP